MLTESPCCQQKHQNQTKARTLTHLKSLEITETSGSVLADTRESYFTILLGFAPIGKPRYLNGVNPILQFSILAASSNHL